MAEKRPSRGRLSPGRGPGEPDVHQAMRSLGWLVPECEDDVRRAETQLAGTAPPLPAELADAAAVFQGKLGGGAPDMGPIAFGPDAQAEGNLARAARQGGKIPPEIEDRMRRDREDAERELDAGEDGQDVG